MALKFLKHDEKCTLKIIKACMVGPYMKAMSRQPRAVVRIPTNKIFQIYVPHLMYAVFCSDSCRFACLFPRIAMCIGDFYFSQVRHVL